MSAEQNRVSTENGNVQQDLQENGMASVEDRVNRDSINFDNLRSVRVRVTNAVLEMDPIIKVLQNINESINQLSNNVKDMQNNVKDIQKEIRSMKETMPNIDKRLPVGSLEKIIYKEITNTFKAVTNMTEQAIVSGHIDRKYISQELEKEKSNSEEPVNGEGSQQPINDQDPEISDQLNESLVSMTQTTGNGNTQEITNYNDSAVPCRDLDTSTSNTPVYDGNDQASVNDEENISLSSLQRKTMQTQNPMQSSRKRAYEEDDSAETSSETILESDGSITTIKTFKMINNW